MKRGPLIAIAASATFLLAPACVHATTVTVGPSVPATAAKEFTCNVFAPCPGVTFAQFSSPGLDEVPANGTVKSWRVAGYALVALHLLEPGGEEGEWLGQGTSSQATDVKGGANATSLPVRAGDLIGVDMGAPEKQAALGYIEEASAEYLYFEPLLPPFGGATPTPTSGSRILLNADIVLAPVVSSVTPNTGVPTGGNSVTIAGLYLDGATGVKFGSTPASSFSLDSASQITAVAPASTPSTVDVHVTGPGGTSEVNPADRYTFAVPTVAPTPPTTTTGAALAPNGSQPATVVINGFSQSATRWRRGGGPPRISSSAVPLGTRFSFSLNEPATATFTFSQRVAGRRVHGRCVPATQGNGNKPKCRRTVKVGSFNLSGHVGLDKVSFQGRLYGTKTLKPGTYSVSLLARDSRGLKAASQSLSFTIVS